MIARKLALATAATTLALTPVAAYAAPERASAPATEQSQLGGGAEWVNALIIILIGAVGMAALLIADDDDNPTSP
ncbi:hypothetical protein GRI40_10775 [Altererythrobacter aerius]|uniref:Ferrochelatase n=1 Tax=Tsuneonella aeria TaxID=1837929 RepID=A0A6I4TEF6_9SPHN|nr:hypothetical protein [Tsuneonella aeria]MXO75701.1 hypothetical protein [Tsuneonella aeria]